MPRFEYEAIDPDGQAQAGTIEADSRMLATVKLRERGLHLQTLREQQVGRLAMGDAPAEVERSLFYPLHPVPLPRLADLYAQLAELLEAGVGIYEATESLQGRVGRRLERILVEISPKLGAGEALSGNLGKYPQIFPAHVRAMLRAGETSGNLDQACAAIAEQYDQEHELHQKLRLPKMYYGLVLIFCILVPTLPWIISRGFSWYLHQLGTVLLPIIGGLIALLLIGKVVLAIPRVKGVVDDIVFRLPFLAPFGMRAARARMLQTMYILTRSGVDLPTAVNLAGEAAGVRPMAAQLRIAAAKMRERVPVMQALGHCDALSDPVKGALATAEQTGLYEEALGRLAEAAANERRNVINNIVTGSMLTFLAFTAVPVVIAVYIGYRAYFDAIFERAEEWMP